MYNTHMFYFDKIHGKLILKSDLLNDLNHFFTTRESIIRTKEPDFLYLAEENTKIICDYLEINSCSLISPVQTHSANIATVQADKNNYPDTDGLILTDNKQAIFLNFADCVPIILFDKEKNVAAISHAGWRGTAQKITRKTVKKMIDEFGCSDENITAVIGPAISKCCFDIGEDVYEELKSTIENSKGLFEIKENRIFADLKGINYQQLQEAGISKIDICPYCTYCNNDLFFSYRKENATTNRHSAVVKLNHV